MPQVGSSVRARWSHLVTDRRALGTAFAFEAVVDESVFMIGPTLVTLLATAVHPLAGLSAAVVAAVAGTAVLVSLKDTEPPVRARTRHTDSVAMPWPVLAPLTVCGLGMGVLFGGAEVATVAFSDEAGAKGVSGLMLAVWALGSLLSGVVTGALQLRASNATRFRWGLLSMGLVMLPLPFVEGFAMLAVVLFLAGFAISPTLIASVAWIEEIVPADRLTESLTVFTTGLGAGIAPGAALVGVVVDASGASAAYWVCAAAGLAGAGVAFATARVASRGRPSPSGSPASGPPRSF
jgi:predicted MFS family arabinose efflux permease